MNNNNIFSKNIELLNKNKYNFRCIKKLIEYKSKDNKYQLKQTKNNLFAVIYNNKPLTSLYNPREEAKRLISQFIKDDNEHIGIFLSIASFFHIEYFLSLNDDNKAIIIEKDIEIVKLIFENYNLIEENKLKNIIIILDEDLESILSFFNFYMNDNESKKIVYIRHARASNINEETSKYYDDVNIYLAESIKEKLMSLTSNYYFAPIWARNILYNMHFNKGYSIKTFYNILKKEIPILLVSAGASADNYIEKIKHLSKTHFVIVLSHALNTLIKNDIKPNAVISTDGGFYSSIHLTELLKKENDDINIFTTHTAYPFPLTHIDNKRIFYFSHDESFEKILYPINDDDNNNIHLYMEGSVIMPALRIAYMLNPKYILLAGCDFCHIDDKTHSIYSNASAYDFIKSNKLKTFESAKYKRLNDNQKVKCYDNIYRNTSASLLSYKNHFEAIIEEISNTTNIFTLTVQSASIKNVKIYNEDFLISNDVNIDITNYLEETIDKNILIKKINEFIEDINSKDIDSDILNIAYIVSPWHVEKFRKYAINTQELKDYMNKWYNDIKSLIY